MLFHQTLKCDIPASFKRQQSLTWKQEAAWPRCSEANVPCYLLIDTSEFEPGHTCLWPLRSLDDPSRESLDFDFHPLHCCPPGDQMKASAFPETAAYASMKQQSRGPLWLVGCLEDRWVHGAGPGASWRPAGTSLLDCYIRSRILTYQGRKQSNGGVLLLTS